MVGFFVQAQKRFRERQKSKVRGHLQKLAKGFNYNSLMCIECAVMHPLETEGYLFRQQWVTSAGMSILIWHPAFV